MTSGKVAIVAAAGRGPGFIASLPHGGDRAAKVPMRRVDTVAEVARTAAWGCTVPHRQAVADVDTVAEVARTAAFLPGDGAGCVTGRNLRVDGGLARGA